MGFYRKYHLYLHKVWLELEWDSNKNSLNIEKHGFDFIDAYEVFENLLLVELDERKDYSEKRYRGIGNIKGRLVVIVFTERDDHLRVISLRKANSREAKSFKKAFPN